MHEAAAEFRHHFAGVMRGQSVNHDRLIRPTVNEVEFFIAGTTACRYRRFADPKRDRRSFCGIEGEARGVRWSLTVMAMPTIDIEIGAGSRLERGQLVAPQRSARPTARR